MKKLNLLFFLIAIISILFVGCSSNTTTTTKSRTSTMLRTVGVGENSMPIESGSYAIEFFNEQATSLDMINEIVVTHSGGNSPEDEYTVSGAIVSEYCRYYGLNARYGIDNYTETNLGFYTGNFKSGYSNSTNYSYNNDEYYTTIMGVQLGFKRLLTNYISPHRLSIFAEGKYFTITSDGFAQKYDGDVIEVKSALIYGYLPDPTTRNFPSLSMYYSFANTQRDETVEGISLKKQPQALGVEANFNVDMGPVNYMVFAGLEKEIADKATDQLIGFFGMKVGLQFNQSK